MKRLCYFSIALSLMVTSDKAFGDLLAFDGFNYANVGDDVLTADGGFGFNGGWYNGGFNATLSGNFDVGGGSLSYPGLAPSTGNRVTTESTSAIAGLSRDLLQPLGAPGTTRYMSFLVRPEGQLNEGAFNGFFGLLFESGEPEVLVSKPGGGRTRNWVLEERGGSGQIPTNTRAVVDETYFMVVKAEFTAGFDEFNLYVNPAPDLPEPLTADATKFADVPFTEAITIYSTGAFSMDEIRIGETYADVVPVPEPTGWLWLAMGLWTSLGLRK